MNRSSWQAESSEVGDYKTIVKRPTSWIEMMSQQRRKNSKDLKPARRQGKASSKIKLTTSFTEREVWSKVRRFRSFEIIQKMRIAKLSKHLRSTLPNFCDLSTTNLWKWWPDAVATPNTTDRAKGLCTRLALRTSNQPIDVKWFLILDCKGRSDHLVEDCDAFISLQSSIYRAVIILIWPN